ncbi:MAG: hypothetical protein AAFR22_08490, partial [Chloroflexota bacterium]
MIQRITGPLPEWASRSNPLLGYQLRQSEQMSRRARLLRALGSVLLLAALGIGGYTAATNIFSSPAGQNLTESIVEILFYPMVIVQTALGISALAFTIGTIGEERGHETWDNLRATPSGAALTLRTRWVAVFYRLRAGLVLVTLVRLVLIGLVLRDLTAFQGRYIDLLIGGVTPDIPTTVGGVPFSVPAAALMLSLFLTATLLLPFTNVAFDASVGLFLATLLKQRLYSLVFQFVEFVLRIAVVGGLIWLTLGFIADTQPLEAWQAWLTVFGFGAFADWGIMMMHLGFSGEVWGTIPYGIFIGPALLLYALAQAILSDLFLRWAVILAEN